jgi:hypothetical protein
MTRDRDIKARLVTLFLSYRSPSIVESLQTVKAEGFGFNYTRWQQVSSYRSSMSFRSLTLEPVAPVEMASPSIISA